MKRIALWTICLLWIAFVASACSEEKKYEHTLDEIMQMETSEQIRLKYIYIDIDTLVDNSGRWARPGDTIVLRTESGLAVSGIQEYIDENFGGHIHSWDCKNTFPAKYCKCVTCNQDTTFVSNP